MSIAPALRKPRRSSSSRAPRRGSDRARFTPEALLNWLAGLEELPGRSPACVVVVAHPDDEILGLGARLRHLRTVWIVYGTDGSPRNLEDASANGFKNRIDYAAARTYEARQALRLGGVPPARTIPLGFVDQETSLNLGALAVRLCDHFRRLEPDVILTHPYEGGHPDHDATCFGVHAACALLEREGLSRPVLLEFTSYHARNGGLETGEFLNIPGCVARSAPLSRSERELKARMLACHATQSKTLSGFSLDHERFREAPKYRFCSPPHPGTLWYEQFSWGMTGLRWREAAAAALTQLGLLDEEKTASR